MLHYKILVLTDIKRGKSKIFTKGMFFYGEVCKKN